jgi:hypothetical protein
MTRIIWLCLGLLLGSIGLAWGVATTPAVNAPLTSMGGGTAPSTIYSTTARQTINTTGDTSCFSATGQGPGLTIAANAAYAGNQYLLNCSGVYTVPVANASTITAKIKWGSTTVVSVTIPAVATLSTNLPFMAQANCTIMTIGASGSIECWSQLCFSSGLTGGSLTCTFAITTSAQTIDTTASSKIDMTAAWSAITTTQSATVNVANAQILF